MDGYCYYPENLVKISSTSYLISSYKLIIHYLECVPFLSFGGATKYNICDIPRHLQLILALASLQSFNSKYCKLIDQLNGRVH